MNEPDTEGIAEAIIMAVENALSDLHVETGAMENVFGGHVFDVAHQGVRYVVSVTEYQGPDE